MALVTEQIIPPSLADRFNALVKSLGGTRYGLNGQARAAAVEPPPDPAVAIARAAALWLANQWRNPADKTEHSAFYAARYAELRAGTFPAAYWRTATQTLNYTLKSVPISSAPFTGAWSQDYYDPLRLPTNCIYEYNTSAYATPSGDGAEAQPAPGWRGEVSGGYFRDVWHAMQTWLFTLPYAVTTAATRPILIRTQTTISASSTIRGNQNWFPVSLQSLFRTAYQSAVLGGIETLDHWNAALQSPLLLPAAHPAGWNHTLAVTRLQDARHQAEVKEIFSYPKVQIVLATPPSLGFYYSRNDAVRVVHHSTCSVYQARTSSD